MSTTGARLPEQVRQVRGLKSVLTVAILVLLYVWSGNGLSITPSKLLSGTTWRNMADIFIRMGPFDRINRCRDAQLVWGDTDPFAGKPNPAKVKAVCEQDQTLYWYQYGNLKDQVRYVADIWVPLRQTLQMAILGTALGGLFAIPFSLLAARNLMKSKALYAIVRSVLNLIRTVPDLVLAALMTGIFGLGAVPGIFALAVFAFALIAKLTSESIEAIDPGPLEAMQATGADRLQQIRYGVVPQVLPQFFAYTLYVLEICVRSSTILGLVGAGGIGVVLNTNLNLTKYQHVGSVVAALLVAVLAIDIISTKLRERLV